MNGQRVAGKQIDLTSKWRWQTSRGPAKQPSSTLSTGGRLPPAAAGRSALLGAQRRLHGRPSAGKQHPAKHACPERSAACLCVVFVYAKQKKQRRLPLACVWWSMQCALVSRRRPAMANPDPLLLYCRLRCHGSEKLGSLCTVNTWARSVDSLGWHVGWLAAGRGGGSHGGA